MKPTRVGYAPCSTARQELQSQLDALAEAGCDPVLSEKISTPVKGRPEFVKAMDFARTIKKAVPHQRVIFTVHETKRLGRGAAELLATAEDLRSSRHPARTPHRPPPRGLRPLRARRRSLRLLRRHGRVRTRVHPGEVPRRPGVRP
ncbi:recombinase family protein [Streptomyces antibioticus]|uniref:recombinase family protein n=1 Tax=Streptomyces antibioticus TaxID=1890 RepID=UPI0036AB33C7